VTRVATQGRNGGYTQWVKRYKLQYSNDGVKFQYYREQRQTADKVTNVWWTYFDQVLRQSCFN
jgi:hypothetical protein